MGTSATIVYRATNLVNGKTYIGYTARGLAWREVAHRRDARNGRGHVFHAALRKYGDENFVFAVMYDFDGDEELARLYEVEAIAKYKPEYNLSHGGEGGSLHPDSRKKIGDANRGRKMPPSHGEKRRAFLTGRKHTEETKAKMSAAQKGHAPTRTGPLPDEVKRKISAANKGQIPWTAGQKHSAETREKMSAWQRGRKLPEEMRQNVKAGRRKVWETPSDAMLLAVKINNQKAIAARKLPVKCVEDGRVFAGSSDADRYYGFKIGLVSRIVKGTVKNKTGLTFVRYEAD